MHVLRLCSVYEAPPKALGRSSGFDVVGGMQVHTARLTEKLDAAGVEQTVLTAYRPGAPRAQRIGTRSQVYRVGLPIRRVRQLYGFAAVRTVARTQGIDLVHVHLGEDLAIAPLARWAAARSGTPLVATVHCSLEHTLVGSDRRSTVLRLVGRPVHARLLRAARAILVLSERLARALIASGVPRSHVRVIPLGIELASAPTARPASMVERRWIVFAGRLVREKGVRELVSAFGMVRAEDIGLLVLGDGPERASLEAAARASGLADRVRFVHAVPHPDVRAYLAHADVVVLPSWFEERGRVVLEAMSAGTPVVASHTGGVTASVRHEANGLLVPPRDPHALASAIERLLSDRALAASLAEAGRESVAGHGTRELADATLAAYEAALERPAVFAHPLRYMDAS